LFSSLITWETSADARIRTPRRLARFLRRWLAERKAESLWRQRGRPPPPPGHVKRTLLHTYARCCDIRVFVETGTYYGDTLAALRNTFDELHSIELDRGLYRQAVTRFARDSRIKLWHGDSGDMLAHVVQAIYRPALFWLDGHYSGEGTARGILCTPISRELAHIGRHALKDYHLIIIDDARSFDGTDNYPTVEELGSYVASLGLTVVRISDDMIFVVSARSKVELGHIIT
jgi:hypothetical protein